MRPLALLLLLPAVALAQSKDKPSPLDKIDGYKRHVIEGFTLLVNDAVAAELKARAAFEPIRKLDSALMAQAGAFDPKADAFQQKNGRAILELLAAVEGMKKKHPKAKATEQAEAVAKKYAK